MRPLYEINKEIEALVEDCYCALEEDDGIISDEVGEALAKLQMEKSEKIGNVCRYIKSLNAEAEMFKAESKKLTEYQKSAEKKSESLKKFLSCYVPKDTKLIGENYKISWRKGSKLKILVDTEFIPKAYINVKIDESPDKKKITADLKRGENLDWAYITKTNNIQVK